MTVEPPEIDYKALASQIDKAGWQQFSFAKTENHEHLLSGTQITLQPSDRLVVVTHSCDLIHHTAQERDVEFLVLELAAQPSEKELASQSSRLKFIQAYAPETQFLKAQINRRFFVPRIKLGGLHPDLTISLRSSVDLKGLRGKSERKLTEWLAGRYNRGWTPSEFDRRIKGAVGKIQRCLNRIVNLGVEDIYIRVTPSEELRSEDDPYEITLLFLVDPQNSSNEGAITAEAKQLSTTIQQQKGLIVVTTRVELSSLCAHGEVRDCLRFPEIFRDALAAS